MPFYSYIAKTRTGKDVKGRVEAQDESFVIAELRKKDLIIIKVEEIRAGGKKSSRASKKVKLDDLVMFCRQFATMIDSGIPVVTALDILSAQTDSKGLGEIVTKLRYDVETGSALSESLSHYPDVFSPLFVNMVRAGETSGGLDEIMDRLGNYLEKTSSLQRKIKSALTYPVIVMSMAIIITLSLLLKVIPIFKEIYGGFNATLPGPTMILIAVSDFIRAYFLFVMISGVVAGILTARFFKTPKGELFRDRIVLKLPIFGLLARKVAISKFSRTLSTLIKSGVPILGALEIVSKTAGNKVLELAIENVRNNVKEGENIAEPLSKSNVFPPMVVRMVSVGEKSGELEKMLTKIADFYEDQVEAAIAGLTSMIEPLIIAFLGIVIGGVVICMFLPIFNLSNILNM